MLKSGPFHHDSLVYHDTHKSPLTLSLLRNLSLSDSRRLTGNTGAVLLAPLSTSHALTRCYVCSHRHTAGQQPQHRGRPPRTNSLLPAAMQRGWSKQQGAASSSLCPPDGQRTDTCVSARVCVLLFDDRRAGVALHRRCLPPPCTGPKNFIRAGTQQPLAASITDRRPQHRGCRQ